MDYRTESMAAATITAENHVDAYRLLDLPTMPNGTTPAMRSLVALIYKHHADLTPGDRASVASAVISAWITDYDS